MPTGKVRRRAGAESEVLVEHALEAARDEAVLRPQDQAEPGICATTTMFRKTWPAERVRGLVSLPPQAVGQVRWR